MFRSALHSVVDQDDETAMGLGRCAACLCAIPRRAHLDHGAQEHDANVICVNSAQPDSFDLCYFLLWRKTECLTTALGGNVQKQSDIEDVNKPEAAARLAIAFLSAGFGFLSGMIIWFAMPRAFDTSLSVFFWLSVILAAVFFS